MQWQEKELHLKHTDRMFQLKEQSDHLVSMESLQAKKLGGGQLNSENSNKKEDPKAKKIISARVLNRKIQLAEEALTTAGLIGIHGSGSPVVEDIITLLKLFSNDQLEVKRR